MLLRGGGDCGQLGWRWKKLEVKIQESSVLKHLVQLRDGLLQEEGREGGGRPRPGSEEPHTPVGREEGERGRSASPLVLGRCPQPASLLLPGPQCPLPFNTSDVAGGVVLCEPASGPGGAAVQRCQLLCRRGYLSTFPLWPLECSLERRRWLSQPPQPRACQRE